MITVKSKNKFEKSTTFMAKISKSIDPMKFHKYGQAGVNALQSATPKRSGKTAESWSYKIENKNGKVIIRFLNSNVVSGVPIAVILQYGHGTRNGGWVEGRDYINPALRPIFDKMAESAWKEVHK